MNSKSNSQAMETEKIPRLLAQLAIPAVVAQIINLLYNIVDRIYIGHISGVGAAALTGVGLFTPILMLINAFAMLAGSGKPSPEKRKLSIEGELVLREGEPGSLTVKR